MRLAGLAQAGGDVPVLAHRIEIVRVGAAALDARQGRRDRADAGQFSHRRRLAAARLLRQIGNAARTQAAAGAGRQFAGQQAREHRLAHAVASHQAGAAQVELVMQV